MFKKKNKVNSTKEETTVSAGCSHRRDCGERAGDGTGSHHDSGAECGNSPRQKLTYEDFTQSVDTLTEEDLMAKQNTQQGSGQKLRKRSGAGQQIFFSLHCFLSSDLFLWSVLCFSATTSGAKSKAARFMMRHRSSLTCLFPGKRMLLVHIPGTTHWPAFPETPLCSLFLTGSIPGKTDGVSSTSGYDQQLEQMRASLTALREVNSDVYGWIYVEGTNINYPLVRGTDNIYYLDHSYNHNYLPIGSIFVDCTTKDIITDNYNTVIYGHNVAAGSMMFHDVVKLLNEDLFYSAKIYIYTMEGVYIYQPFSIYQTTSDYQYFRTGFTSEESFLEFANEMISNSKFPTDTTFSSGDTMITLSTCTNGAANGRYALHAKLVEVVS